MDLQKWCTEYNALGRAVEAFYDALEEYKLESPKEYKKAFGRRGPEPVPVFDKVYHMFTIPDFDRERVYLDLNILSHETVVGWFRMIFDMEGHAVDDFFVIE